MDIISYVLAKKYTDESVAGIGIIRGAPCQVKSITKVGKVTTITLEWVDSNNISHTQSFDILDGVDGLDGSDGVSVVSATITNNHLILTLSNGNNIDAGNVTVRYDVMPTASSENVDLILQYVGNSTTDYINGYFYKCVTDGTTYSWTRINVQPNSVESVNGKTGVVILSASDVNAQDIIQYSVMPTASVDYLGKIYQYTGESDGEYISGCFYKCIYDNDVYDWELIVGGVSNVESVNGKTGIVILTADDVNAQKIIQYSTMPIASSSLSDKIYQYIGETNENYVNGYYYKCSNQSGSYAWEQLNTQPTIVVDNTLSNTSENPLQNKVIYSNLANKVDKITGKSLSTNDYTNTDKQIVDNVTANLATKADKVDSATNGDFAGLDSNGNLIDTNKKPSDFIEKSGTQGLVKNDGTIDTNSYATTAALANKVDKVTDPTVDNITILDENGGVADSNISKNIIPTNATTSNKLTTVSDLPTELNDLNGDVNITSPVNAQILAYNSTSGKWENQTGQVVIGSTVFKGSITYANIPTSGMLNGDWYNIKNAFTTDSRFEEGAGIECTAGTDIIWITSSNKWNILTPSGVNSFNGRTGVVLPASGDYTKSDVGLGNVVNTGDSDTPVSGGTTKFTTGGAYTELNKKQNKTLQTSLNIEGDLETTVEGALDALNTNKQKTLTFDSTPIKNSNNPVKSDGIYESISDIYSVIGQNGAKNLLPLTLSELKYNNLAGTWNDKVYTFSGMTFTVVTESDNETVTEIIVNGQNSSSSNVLFNLAYHNFGNIAFNSYGENNSEYILTSGTNNDSAETYFVRYQNYAYMTYISITGDYQFTNISFKPMLRLKADIDDEFQPYAMTNKQLTKELATKQDILTFDSEPTDSSTNPVTSDGVYETIVGTVGWIGGKNLLKNTATNTSVSNVSFTVNANKSVTVSGNNSTNNYAGIVVGEKSASYGDVFVASCGSNALTSNTVRAQIDFYNGSSYMSNVFVLNDNTNITVPQNTTRMVYRIYVEPNYTIPSPITIYPMIRKTGASSIYEPYHASVDESKYNRSEANVLGAKNLFNGSATTTTDSYGLTWTVDSDDNNIITVSGTPTGFQAFSMYSDSVLPVGAYILSGWGETTNVAVNIVRLRLNGSTVKTYEGTEANSLTITIDDTVYDEVVIELKRKVNNVACSGTAKIMIRLASDTDTTYQPYAETNYQLTQNKMSYKDNGVLGAKNLFKNEATTKTVNGITFTVNADKSITVSGTASANTYLSNNAQLNYNNGSFIPTIGKSYTFTKSSATLPNGMRVYINNVNGVISWKDADYTFTASTADKIAFDIVVNNGTAISTPITIYPMIRLATDTDSTFQPYAETNLQLTQNKMSYADNGVLGAKNLLPYPNGTRQVISSDGTYTNNDEFYCSDYIEITADFVFSISSRVGEAYARVAYYDSSKTFISRPVLNTLTAGQLSEVLVIPYNAKYLKLCMEDSGAYFANPMLRLASDTDDTYVPYAKTNKELTDEIATKQNILTFDTTPTDGSSKPVTSDGIYEALATKADTSDIPTALSQLSGDSTHRVVTDTEKATWNGKQNTLTFDASPTDNSSNPVTSDGVYEANKNIYGVMGSNGAKNLNVFPYYEANPTFTIDGVTYTTDENGVITATTNGATSSGRAQLQLHGRLPQAKYAPMYLPKGTYKFSIGCSDNEITSYIATTYNGAFTQIGNIITGSNEGEFTIDDNTNSDYKLSDGSVLTAFYVRSSSSAKVWNNIKIYPMIRLASDTDSTYQPYAETNYQLTQNKMSYKDNGILGAKNLFNGSAPNWSGGTGITIAKNTDYSLSISAGTLTSDFTYPSEATRALAYDFEPNKSYIFSYGDTTIANVELQVYYRATSSSSWTRLVNDSYTNEISFTIPSSFHAIWARMLIRNAKTVVASTLYPMIRLATDTDATYQPYAQTNQQLTTSKANASALGNIENDDTASKAYAIGEHFSRFGDFCTVTQPIASGGRLEETTNYVVDDIADNLVFKAGDTYYINNDVFAGFITSGSAEIYLSIPLPKRMVATGATFSGGKVAARGIGGYILQFVLLSSLSISLTNANNYSLYVKIKNTDSSAFDVTNNTPLAVLLSDVTITFS